MAIHAGRQIGSPLGKVARVVDQAEPIHVALEPLHAHRIGDFDEIQERRVNLVTSEISVTSRWKQNAAEGNALTTHNRPRVDIVRLKVPASRNRKSDVTE